MAKTISKVKDSFARNPLPWIVLAGGAIYLASRGVKAVSNLASKGLLNKFETSASSNPFAFRSFMGSIPKGTTVIYFTTATATQIAQDIYSAFGYFTDDETAVLNAFRKFKTQAQVAQVAQIFSTRYKTDLLQYLKQGYGPLPQAGLSDEEYQTVLKLVNALPKYK
jgi:hypothetical protein